LSDSHGVHISAAGLSLPETSFTSVPVFVKVSFWNALILQAARAERCDRLWTEDLNHGQRVGELTIVNPFLPEPPPAGEG
jgi:predicted nucleic acid-binding protein